jgi:enterochelin esterase family protein
VWSSPAFAEGAVFARSQGEIARVDWRPSEAAASSSTAPSPATGGPRSSRLASLLAEVAAAADKPGAVDRFLASLPPGPLVEWPDRVAFLYRGKANDVGIAGDMIGDRREDPMSRVPGTDLFWYETTLPPDARISYHFVRDFEERFPDSRNPWRVPAPPTGTIGAFPEEQSSLAMPAWRPPDHLVEAAPERRGRIEELVIEGASRPGSRVAVRLYVPAGVEKGRPPLPLALVLDGDNAREKGLLPRSLDNLIPARVAPVLVAFVSRPEWGDKPPTEEETEDAVANLLAHDVVPFLERRHGTDPRREARALVGTGFAAWRAAYAAFRHPTTFGALGLQSLSMLDTDQGLLEKQVRSAAQAPLRVYLDWGRYDRRGTREAWDMRRANQRFDAFLRERGYSPAGGEVPEGAGWAGWRNRTDRVFEALFPAPPAAGAAARREPAYASPSRAARSARSLGRPAARLFAARSARLRKGSRCRSTSKDSRLVQASSKVTPLISVRMSIRLGTTPIWKTVPGRARSSSVRSWSGALKARRASSTRPAFCPVGRTQMSRSPVARGRPWAASAWAPTIRNSAPASDSADNISAKSRFIPVSVLERPRLRRELPHHRHPLPRGEPADVVPAVLVLQPQLPGRVVAPIHRLHCRRLPRPGETLFPAVP